MINRESKKTIQLLRGADFRLPGQMARVRRRINRKLDHAVECVSPAPVERRRRSRLKRFALAAAITAGAAAMTLTIPPVRAFAEELLIRFRDFFFDTAEESEVELTGPQFFDSERWIVNTREELKERASFDVRSLDSPPQDLAFSRALVYHTSRSAVVQVYRSQYRIVHVLQQPLADAREHGPLGYPVGIGIADDAPLTDVDIGRFTGQQVHGTWVGSKGEYRWRLDFPVNRVRFSDEAFLYGVEVRAFVTRADLEKVAMPSRQELADLALAVARALVADSE